MKNRRLTEILFYGALIFIMVFSLNLAVRDSTGMDISLTQMALLSLGTVTLIIGLMTYPLITAGISVALGLGLFLLNIPETITFVQSIPSFIEWLPGYIIGYNYFDINHSTAFALLYTLLIATCITLTAFSYKTRFVPILLGVAVLSFFWFIYVEKARIYMMLYLFAAVQMYAYNVYRQKTKEWEKAGSTIAPNVGIYWVVNGALIIILSIGLSLFFPLNVRPVQSIWLNEKMLTVFPFIADWRNDSMESFGYGFGTRYDAGVAGYKGGKASKVGGPVSLDDSVMFTIDVNDYNNLYLRGTVKDSYSGSAWFKTTKEYHDAKPGEKLNLLPNTDSSGVYRINIRVTPKKLLTSSIFAPNHIDIVKNEKEYRFYIDDEMDAFFPKVITKNGSYEVESVVPYIDENKLRQVDVKRGAPHNYLELPYNFSDRVQKLAREITAGYDNDYDKIKAIESYLRKNYKYTLKPSRIPRGRELVDYFLFEEKQGYCTYYATSMAMMLRSIDIPCRYVEGFLSKPEKSATRNIRGTDAHAWVEVYFGEYGWVTFEPTAAYGTVQYRQPVSHTQTPTKPADTEVAVPASTQIDEEMSGNTKDKELREFEEGETLSLDDTQDTSKSKKPGVGILVFGGLLALLLLRILTRHLAEMLFEIRLRTLKGKQYAGRYFKEILWYFGKLGIKIEKGETMREFIRKVENQFGDDSREASAAADILEKMNYSQKEISGEERAMLERFRKSVKTLAVQRLSGILLFVYLYIIGK